MKGTNFTEINTLIDIREQRRLTENQFNEIIDAQNNEEIVRTLEDTRYHFRNEDLINLDRIEERLMASLIEEYRFAFNEVPHPSAVEVFAAKYMYHNLKLIYKMLVTDLELDHLYIPIGRYSIDELYHVVQTQESTVLPKVVTERLNQSWTDYQTYHDTEAFDVGMDMAYFDHLRDLAQYLENVDVTNIINVRTDFYNIITVMRALRQNKSNSFMYEMMTEQGTHTIAEFIELVSRNEIAGWFDEINQLPYDTYFEEPIRKMQEGTITAVELERLEDRYLHHYFSNRRLDGTSIIPVLSYLFYKEMEVKNLRLVLTGRTSGLPKQAIVERMRPIYGEKI